VRPHGQGLGFNPRNNNNYAIPPKKINFVKEGYKGNGNGNGKKDAMGGNVMSTHFYSCRHLLGLQVQRFIEQQQVSLK
jgi:hypothetical protein